MNKSKLEQSLIELKQALRHRAKAQSDHLTYSGIAKCFEVCLEYAWKQLKRELEESGVDAFSPKDVVKAAGRAGLVADVEVWIKCINVRNFAVHDYLGVTQEEYLDLIESFVPLAAALVKKLG